MKDVSPLCLFRQPKSPEALDKYTRALKQTACKFLEETLEGDYEGHMAQIVRRGRDDPD